MTKARDVADLLANGTVDTDELADGLITTAKLADNSVTTAKIPDAAITAAKLNVQGSDIPYDNTTSGISANTLQEAIDYLNVLSGGGSAGAQATYTREKFTATAGQTTFTTANGYTLGYLQVFMNGIMLDTSDYAATDQSTVVLGTGAAAGDEIVTIAYDSFAISEVLRVLSISASAPNGSLTIDSDGKIIAAGGSLSGDLSVVNGKVAFGGSATFPTGSTDPYIGRGPNGYLELGSRQTNHSAAYISMKTVGLERLKVDNNGRVTMPYQPHIVGTPGNGVVGGSGAADRFTARNARGGMAYTTTGGNGIAVPVSGVYSIIFQTLLTSGSGRQDSFIYINGTVVSSGLNNTDDTGYRMRTHSMNTYLYAGDKVNFGSDDWYAPGTAVDTWQIASVTLIS